MSLKNTILSQLRLAAAALFLIVVLLPDARAYSTILAASTLGPLRSTDGGTTWQILTVNANSSLLPGQPNSLAVAVDPKNPATWYSTGVTSTGAYGFYKSPDSGQTWSAVPLVTFQPQGGPGTIAVDPVMTNVIYLIARANSSNNFIVKSTDFGSTWSQLRLPSGTAYPAGNYPLGAEPFNLTADPKNSGVLFALAGTYIFKTTDFGLTWVLLSTGVDTPEAGNMSGGTNAGFPALARLDVDPRDSQILYASPGYTLARPECKNVVNGGQCGLYKSTDGGATWLPLSLPAPSARSLSVDPNTGTIYVGASVLGYSVVKSTDGGSTWTPLKNGFLANGPFVRVDPAVPSTVYAAEELGSNQRSFYRSTDGGANWTTISLPRLCPIANPQCSSSTLPPVFSDLLVLPQAGSPAAGIPSISQNGIVNAAGFQAGIVANSWVTIFGSNFASSADDWSKSIVNGQFPTTLDGISVTISGKPAYIYYITSTQLNILVPEVGIGPQQVIVTNSKGASSVFTVTSSQYAPAFFLWPNNQPVTTKQDFSFAAKSGTFPGVSTTPARPGDVVILWGTGFGPTSPTAPAGMAVPGDATYSTASLPTVTVNKVPATVFGAALAPGFAGLYQVAIQVPSSMTDGDWPVQATIGDVQSPAGVLLSVRR